MWLFFLAFVKDLKDKSLFIILEVSELGDGLDSDVGLGTVAFLEVFKN